MKYRQTKILEDTTIDEVFKKHTHRELSKLTGVHFTHFSRIKSGEYILSEKLYKKLKELQINSK